MSTQRCPRCVSNYLKNNPNRNALSRRDNETLICSECGTAEALEDSGLIPSWDKKPYWKEAS